MSKNWRSWESKNWTECYFLQGYFLAVIYVKTHFTSLEQQIKRKTKHNGVCFYVYVFSMDKFFANASREIKMRFVWAQKEISIYIYIFTSLVS